MWPLENLKLHPWLAFVACPAFLVDTAVPEGLTRGPRSFLKQDRKVPVVKERQIIWFALRLSSSTYRKVPFKEGKCSPCGVRVQS